MARTKTNRKAQKNAEQEDITDIQNKKKFHLNVNLHLLHDSITCFLFTMMQ